VYSFNKWFGGVLDLGAVHHGNIRCIHLDNTAATFMAHPRLAFRNHSNFVPYVQALFGGVYATTSIGVDEALFVPGMCATAVIPAGDNLRFTRNQAAFGMTAGVGLDIRINHHVSFRPFQLEYLLTRLHNYRSFGDSSQNNLRYSTGFNFTWGGEEPAPPPAIPKHARVLPPYPLTQLAQRGISCLV